MTQNKVLRRREIEILIEQGRYDEAEDLLKDSVIPNTRALQERIDTLRSAAQPAPPSSAPDKRGKRLLYTFIVAAGFAVAVILIIAASRGSNTSAYLVLGFVFFIPLLYLSFARNARREKRLNRSRYRRSGYGPRRRYWRN
jgi:Flp pilus assembly protein TadB